MVQKHFMVLITLFVILFSTLPAGFAQDSIKTIQISPAEIPPKIDGRIDDTCWENLHPASGFIQHDPVNGVKASEETLVWATYDRHYLYFAFLMKDTQPDKIWAELTPRNDYENNDAITLILDTYNDRRTSISFTVNPKGVQKNSVETIWKSEAVVRNDGWSAEMAIPFKSLRFSPENNQVWGINFKRYIHRLYETDYWTNVSRDLSLLQQSGELQGLSGIRPGYNLEFFPYAGYRTSHWDGDKDNKLAAGIDVKYGILPNLILDLTASPDFSEVESDPFIYQLSPYENYFQENRPFFSEGSQYFKLATEQEYSWNSSLNLFYSRRIDSPKIAAKISGKTGGYSFGVLGALNDEEDGDSLFTVLRVQKDIFKNSQIGIYYAGSSSSEDYNRNFALDYNFNFKDIYYIRGASALSYNKNLPNKNNGLHLLQFNREPDAGLQLSFDFQRIEAGADVRTGFIERIDYQSFEGMAGYAWRFNGGAVKRFSMDLTGTLRQDASGHLTGNSADFMFFLDFFPQIDINGRFELGKSKHQIVNTDNELVWTDNFIKTYGGDIDFSWERGGFLKEIDIEAGWEKRGVYNDEFTAVEPGSQTGLEAELTLRPMSNLQFSVSGDWIRQVVERTGEVVFDGLTYATALHYQITRNLFLSTRLFGETRENQYNLDVLIGYYFGAGNIIQLSYKKSQRKEGFEREGGYSITLKVSYLLRL
ncbi:MAG: carbohydrate binding family 9 domain-containing protein [Candidatus Aminicenantes bacterium]|nr:carbohydrate binding family 9 domain-containing protein [Candidatus Aminicenantes bacterium]